MAIGTNKYKYESSIHQINDTEQWNQNEKRQLYGWSEPK